MNNIENLVRDTLYDLEQERAEPPADLADRVLRVRRRRPARVAAAVCAAVVAALLIGTQVVSGGGHTASVSTQPPSYVMELGSARSVLLNAADTVSGEPGGLLARPWTYQKLLEVRPQQEGPGEEHGGPQVTEEWTRFADPAFENGRSGDDHSPRERYEFLGRLPADPAQAKAAARAFYPYPGEPRAEHDFRALWLLASSYPVDSRGLARVYRAMATIPGLRAVQTKDAAGRDAIGICLPSVRTNQLSGMYDLLLLDPVTYHYSGFEPMKKTGGAWMTVPEGSTAVLRTGMVGAKGVRP